MLPRRLRPALTARLLLRVIAMECGRLIEVRRCALTAALTGALRVIAPSRVSLDLRSGPQSIVLSDRSVSRV